MSQGADAADQVVREAMQLTEATVKLAALGAKNLAALILALLTNQSALQGKTNLKNLIREGKEPAVFELKTRDLNAFTKEAKKYGIPFSVIKTKGRDTVDIIARAEDAAKINRVYENLGYGARGLENEGTEKNANSRAQSSKESRERGNGSESSAPATTTMTKPVEFVMNQNGEKGISGLDADSLAGIAISLLTGEVSVQGINSLKNLILNGKEPMSFNINKYDVGAFKQEAWRLGIPVCSLADSSSNNVRIITSAGDYQKIRTVLEGLGYGVVEKAKEPPVQSRQRSKAAKEKAEPEKTAPSVKDSVEKAKDRLAGKEQSKKPRTRSRTNDVVERVPQ